MSTADSPSPPEHCANCGAALPPDARFCGTCGTPRAAAEPAGGDTAVPVIFIDEAATVSPASFPPPVAGPDTGFSPPVAGEPAPRPTGPPPTVAAPAVRVPRPLAFAPNGLVFAAVVAGVFAVLSVIGGLVAWDDSGVNVGYGETIGKNAGFIVWGIAVGALWAMVCVFCAGLHSHLDRLARIMLASPSERRAATAPTPVVAAPRRQPPPGLTPEQAKAWERERPVWERS
jgi:hypothetical protein